METQFQAVTIFASFVVAIDGALKNDAEKGRLYSAIAHYSLYGEEPELEGVAAALFELMRPNIDVSNKRRKAGRTGGKKSKPEANVKQNESKAEAKPEQCPPKDEGRGTEDKGQGNIGARKIDDILGKDLGQRFRQWLSVWRETHGDGKEMPRFQQEAQLRMILTLPENIRLETVERAIRGAWKAIHDTRVLRQEENTPGKMPRDYFSSGKNIPAASEYGTRCDEV